MKKLVLIEGLEPDEEPDSSRPSEFTDDALALRLAEANANNLRYVAALGKWLLWDGMRWRFDDTLVARDVARKVCRQASSICNEPKVSKLIASAKTVSAVERLAQSDRELAATVDQWDCDPFLLNTPGGVIDLKSGAMGKHDPGDYLTKITGVAPDYQQTTPAWDAFLARVMDGHGDMIEYLQRVAGYSLTGSTQEHALFFCYGHGANGKTTFLDAIRALPVNQNDEAAAINASIAVYSGMIDMKPADPIEGILISQLMVAQQTALKLYRLAWLNNAEYFEASTRYLKLANNAARMVVTLTERLDHHRNRGQQQIVVQHTTTVNANQAVVTDSVVTGKNNEAASSAKLLAAVTDKPMEIIEAGKPKEAVPVGGGRTAK